MFCSNCGKNIGDGANFCSGCGMAVSLKDSQSNESNSEVYREKFPYFSYSEMEELNKVLESDYNDGYKLSKIKPIADLLNSMVSEQSKLREDLFNIEHNLSETPEKISNKKATFVLVLIFSFPALVLPPIALCGFIISIFFYISYKRLKKNFENDKPALEKKKLLLQNEISNRQELIDEFAAKISLTSAMQFLPIDYFECAAIDYMLEMFRKRLAVNIREAIVLYEKELERRANIEQQYQIADMQLAATDRLTNAVNFNTAITYMTSRDDM